MASCGPLDSHCIDAARPGMGTVDRPIATWRILARTEGHTAHARLPRAVEGAHAHISLDVACRMALCGRSPGAHPGHAASGTATGMVQPGTLPCARMGHSYGCTGLHPSRKSSRLGGTAQISLRQAVIQVQRPPFARADLPAPRTRTGHSMKQTMPVTRHLPARYTLPAAGIEIVLK